MRFLALSDFDTGNMVIVNTAHVESIAQYLGDNGQRGVAIRTVSGNTIFAGESFDSILRSFQSGDLGRIVEPRV